MNAIATSLSTTSGELPSTNPAAPPVSPIADHWPTLAGAISRYERSTAEFFSRAAYDAVDAGMIRLDDRNRLADLAESLAIRPFDAQLLIACAIRRWALDRRYDSTPSPDAPALSFEYRSWRRVWTRIALVFIFALTLDAIILWKWLF